MSHPLQRQITIWKSTANDPHGNCGSRRVDFFSDLRNESSSQAIWMNIFWRNNIQQNVFSANRPFGKMSFRQKVRSLKCAFVKLSIRQNVRSGKCLSAKGLSAKCLSAKCPGTIFISVDVGCYLKKNYNVIFYNHEKCKI